MMSMSPVRVTTIGLSRAVGPKVPLERVCNGLGIKAGVAVVSWTACVAAGYIESGFHVA